MESTFYKNKTDNEPTGFWHSGWAYLIFLGVIILIFIALYYVLKFFGLT
jgi:hypothetical protein